MSGTAPPQQSAANGKAEEDPEKKAKKAAKQAEKDAKKAKAAAKADAAAKAKAAAASGDGGASKKAAAKKASEEKRAAEAEQMAQIIDAAKATKPGHKKDYTGEMPKAYDPKFVEAAVYAWWEGSGFFKPDASDKDTEKFTMVIPPPNVTGQLHVGHALMVALEDLLVRWHRMSGRNVLWVPGMDHAGIATQVAVEKRLQRERGVSRYDLGREAFIKEVFKWVESYGGRIQGQIRRMGASPDWDREAFTMDSQLSRAVVEAFVRLHADGLVYRHNRLVNWDCTLKTAISDIEVDYIDVPENTQLRVPGYDSPVQFGVLISFAYKLEDGEGEIVVATTRIETMLGDTAVAVHPDDPRYKHLHNKHVIHPIGDRRIPIITDAQLVDMSFGTGAVKITPAHDPNDYATGQRHNLESINILTDEGMINEAGGQFAGQPRFKARETVVAWLQDLGLYRGQAGNAMRLGLCSRSKDVIEPVLKPQWYVNCQGMAAEACTAARDGRLTILPSEYQATWFRWMENIRDWCISRQLWFGHRIPAWYVRIQGGSNAAPGGPSEDMSAWVVGRNEQEAAESARQKFPGKEFSLEQDEDVLDTWFSSGLFPFSVFGWPENTGDLQAFYPTSLLETGHDILFFWVARMVMMGMQLTKQVPFSHVYLHSMVRDAHGRKMSKSLGNVIDPLHVLEGISLKDLHATLEGGNLDPKEFAKAKEGQKKDFPEGIEECGADALRFALAAYTNQANNVNLDIKRVVAYRHWCNKLWNAVRFASKNLGDDYTPPAKLTQPSQLPWACRWILSRLNAATQTTVHAMHGYMFSDASTAIFEWWQYRLCDVFIELVKPVMSQQEGDSAERDAFRETLWLCLDNGLRLLHPFMPFVTEELWQRLPRAQWQSHIPSIMVAPYPQADSSWADSAADSSMEDALAVMKAVRSLRISYGLLHRQQPPVSIKLSIPASSPRAQALSRPDATAAIGTLAPASRVEVLTEGQEQPQACGVEIVDSEVMVCLEVGDLVDASKEIEKLGAQQGARRAALTELDKQMGASGYLKATPASVQEHNTERRASLQSETDSLEQQIQAFKRLLSSR
ncbi:hypothetical protein WJX73_007614 [Symbiochloris irregularis]|uniref:Valine--tRNA ligase, mitochondrial n=1 Tax=Symbiochloris irregularis TaxID=706552 RepID=A0AAW1NWT1_9CHLO